MSQPPTVEPPRRAPAPEGPPPPQLPRRRPGRDMASLIASFGYAFAGVRYLLGTQRNAQIHCLMGGCALALAAVLRVERWEWVALVLTIALVLAAEGFNSALEAAVDLATSQRHPLAKVAKDVGAGTVLLCAIASVVVGCIIFIPHLWQIALAVLARAG